MVEGVEQADSTGERKGNGHAAINKLAKLLPPDLAQFGFRQRPPVSSAGCHDTTSAMPPRPSSHPTWPLFPARGRACTPLRAAVIARSPGGARRSACPTLVSDGPCCSGGKAGPRALKAEGTGRRRRKT